MYPWNQNLWMYARAHNFNPGVSLYTRHRSGYLTFIEPTAQRNTSESSNPLLIVQTATGAPSKESERY